MVYIIMYIQNKNVLSNTKQEKQAIFCMDAEFQFPQ